MRRPRPPSSAPSAGARALFGSGLEHQQDGDLAGAIACYARALELDPDLVPARLNLGVALLAQGSADAAADSLSAIVAVHPRHARAWYNLGNAERARGRHDRAAQAYERAAALDPGQALAHNNLGALRLEGGDAAGALAAFERAIAADPTLAAAQRNRGLALAALGRDEEAMAALGRAIALDPDFAAAHADLAERLKACNRVGEAIARYRRALELTPDSVPAIARLAALLEETGELDAAETLAARGLTLAPADASLQLTAARCERRRGRLEQAAARLERLSSAAPDAEIEGAALKELGQVLDRLGDAARAFECFTKGNRRMAEAARAAGHDPAHFVAACRTLVAPFTSGRWPPAPRAGDDPEDGPPAPVFLVGFPRSGTTLLAQLLAGHPRVALLDETPVAAELAARVTADPDRYPHGLASLDTAASGALASEYHALAARYVAPAADSRLVDKLPLNLLRVPFLWRVFPRARFVLSVRHPLDVCLSCYMQNFRLSSAMASFLDLERTAALYVEALDLWLECERRLPLASRVVRYEDLIADTAGEMRGLLDFLELDWRPSVLEHVRTARARGRINTPSYHQVSEPVYRHAAYRWRRYARPLAPLEQRLRPFVERFGYEDEPCSGR